MNKQLPLQARLNFNIKCQDTYIRSWSFKILREWQSNLVLSSAQTMLQVKGLIVLKDCLLCF